MIEIQCGCGTRCGCAESAAGQAMACPGCGATLLPVAAEALPPGSGAGDFDVRLALVAPDGTEQQLFPGGVAEITLGKSADRHICLNKGKMVSRSHAKLVRLDFGPSRWRVDDTQSTNGLFVNGKRVASHELADGDSVRVGDYTIQYAAVAPAPIPKAPRGPTCPSCNRPLSAKAKVCVQCGIDVKTGRALVLSKDMDEDALAIRADTWLRMVSLILPFGLLPIASEAFGARKPIATWVVTLVTLLASVAFYIAVRATAEDPAAQATTLNFMQWNGDITVTHRLLQHVDPAKNLRRFLVLEHANSLAEEGVGFRWWQPLTSAFLHDYSALLPFIFHLGGNLLFLWVFGMRVNELLGNLKFGVIYPALAVASSMAMFIAHRHEGMQGGLGASGAVMGLAGMYFVFFPIQKVYMAIWLRAGALTGWRCVYKVWKMRGFWLLLLWVGYNDVLPTILGSNDHVGHWAHLGGFLVGMMIALGLLLTRQADAHRNDILSVALGKHSWKLLGSPAGSNAALQPAA